MIKNLINVFNRYDIRGNYPNEINEEFAFKLGKSAGSYCRQNFKNNKIAVGCDTRKSSPTLKKKLIDGLISTGIYVIDIDKATTDKTALAGNYYNCAFSIMITASHLSFEHNGFKFIYNAGNGFSNQDMEKIKNIFTQNKFIEEKISQSSCCNKSKEFDKIYETKIYYALQKYINIDDLKGLKIVADCCNSCASVHLINLLQKLKCNIIKVNCSLNANNNNNIEPLPTEKNRQYISQLVKKEKADIGIGVDPDADRVFGFDNFGKFIRGDEIFCLLAKIINAKKIVASLDTSSMLKDCMNKSKIIYTKIGDIFVSQKAIEINADFLGEPNGHFAFPKFCRYNSGIFASLMLCSIAKKISYKIKNLPKYYVESKEILYQNDEQKQKSIKQIKAKIRENFEVITELCGIKFKLNNSVCLIRSSGTSPIIRIFVENKDKAELKKDVKELMIILE